MSLAVRLALVIVSTGAYLGLLLSALGRAFAFRSGVGLLLWALLIPPLLSGIRSEERLLET